MTTTQAGEGFALPPLLPAVSSQIMLRNMRSALARGLPSVSVCKRHGLTLSIAGGGPSLADTCHELKGYIAGINGSLRFLLERPIVAGASYLCGVTDPGAHIADMLVADKSVRYYVASICDPSVFDKLKDCRVILWHPTPESTGAVSEATAILNELAPSWLAIGGGCTMGLRWMNLGYVLGFRKFHLHGMDSSFRDGATHAYPDRADSKERITVRGRQTRFNFLAQARDFFAALETFSKLDPITIEMHGDGLLQDFWREWQDDNPGKFAA